MIVDKIKNYKFSYSKDVGGKKYDSITKLLPKKMGREEYESQIYDYIHSNILH